MKSLLLAGLTIAGLVTFAATSQAALIYDTTISGGNINYGASQNSASFLQAGDFLTLYDAGGAPINLSGDLANSSLFTITTNFLDTPATNVIVTDSATITNLRFTYIGGTNLSDMNLGGFSLVDPSGLFRLVSEDGASHNLAGRQSDVSTEVAPLASPTPEPSTLVLLTTGMLALAGSARRRFLRS